MKHFQGKDTHCLIFTQANINRLRYSHGCCSQHGVNRTHSSCISQTGSTLVSHTTWLVFILLPILNILICTVLFSLLHIFHCPFISVLEVLLSLSCTLKLYTPCFPALLLSCAVWIGITISLCYCWPAAGGSGQEISTGMDSDRLEQPTSTRAVRLQPFPHCPSSMSPLWSTLDKKKGQHKTDQKHV